MTVVRRTLLAINFDEAAMNKGTGKRMERVDILVVVVVFSCDALLKFFAGEESRAERQQERRKVCIERVRERNLMCEHVWVC